MTKEEKYESLVNFVYKFYDYAKTIDTTDFEESVYHKRGVLLGMTSVIAHIQNLEEK